MKETRKVVFDFNRIFDLIDYQQKKYPNNRFLNVLVENKWRATGIEEFQKKVNALSTWLLNEGFIKGDKIIIVPLSGHPDWMIIDFACQQIGLVVVPLHPSARDHELQRILTETAAKLCICFNSFFADKLKQAAGLDAEQTRVFHLQHNQPGYFQPMDGQEISSFELEKLQQIKSSISDQDLLTILYTSGSTGLPKGIMLSHANVVFNIKTILYLLPLEPQHKVISFLPFSHIFERVTCYAYMACGVSVYFSQSADRFVADFKEVQPYFCTSVPRVLEKMINYVEIQKFKRNRLQRYWINWAIRVGEQFVPFDTEFKPLYQFKLILARWLVLNHWKKLLGGKLKYMVVGAASLQSHISQLFAAANVQIVEAYGMTEAAPLISINRFEPGLNIFGTVGRPVPGLEIKVDQPDEQGEGEILVKGPNIMQGYFKRPDLTSEVLDTNGWLRTGDIGKFVHQHYLKIADRKKDIFKTSAGVYIAPQPLQLHYCSSPFILRCLIIGFQRPFITALMVPDFEVLQSWCESEKIHWTSPTYMVHNIKVRNKIQTEIDGLNDSLSNLERVRNFVLCETDWSVDLGELTVSFKPIRNALMNHYQKEIDKMYTESFQ